VLELDSIRVLLSPFILLISSTNSFKLGYRVGSPFAVTVITDIS